MQSAPDISYAYMHHAAVMALAGHIEEARTIAQRSLEHQPA